MCELPSAAENVCSGSERRLETRIAVEPSSLLRLLSLLGELPNGNDHFRIRNLFRRAPVPFSWNRPQPPPVACARPVGAERGGFTLNRAAKHFIVTSPRVSRCHINARERARPQ